MRLIDKDVLLDFIFKSCNTTEATINNAPTIDPVKRGEWTDNVANYKCSVCSEVSRYGDENYCPNCGAKMESEDNT